MKIKIDNIHNTDIKYKKENKYNYNELKTLSNKKHSLENKNKKLKIILSFFH